MEPQRQSARAVAVERDGEAVDDKAGHGGNVWSKVGPLQVLRALN